MHELASLTHHSARMTTGSIAAKSAPTLTPQRPRDLPFPRKQLSNNWRVPDSESTQFLSRVGVIQFQLMLQSIGVWVQLQTAAYSAGVR